MIIKDARKVAKPKAMQAIREKSFKWNDQKAALVEIKNPRKSTRRGYLDLDSVLQSLPTVEKMPDDAHKLVTTNRISRNRKKAILKRETEQFQKVIAHPIFKSGPLYAISSHIASQQKLKESK